MKKLVLLFLLLFFLISLAQAQFYPFEPSRLIGITSGLNVSEIFVTLLMWLVFFLFLGNILSVFFGKFFGWFFAIAGTAVLAYFGFLPALIKNLFGFFITLGSIGIALLIIAAFVLLLLVHFGMPKASLWLYKLKLRQRMRS